MAKRKGIRAHYEAVFEKILRDSEVPYIAINEFKRPIISGRAIKNFDFIVYSRKGKYLVDIKGKFFPYEYKKELPNYWENWLSEDDLEGLKLWQKIFGKDFQSIIVYPYLIKYEKDIKNFDNVCCFKNKTYGIVGIYLKDYLKNTKKRSQKWHAIYVSRDKFRKLARPIKYFIPEIKT